MKKSNYFFFFRFGTDAVTVTLASEGAELETLKKIVFRTGSKIRVLPPDLKDVDLWSVEQESLELLEPIEPSEEELEQEKEEEKSYKSPRTSKHKSNGTREVNDDDKSEISLQESALKWIPVGDDDYPKSVANSYDKVPDLAWKSQNAVHLGETESNEMLINEFIAKQLAGNQSTLAVGNPADMEDFGKDVDDFLKNRNASPSKSVEKCAEDIFVPEKVSRAAQDIVGTLEENFQSRLQSIHSLIKNKSSKDVVAIGTDLSKFLVDDEEASKAGEGHENDNSDLEFKQCVRSESQLRRLMAEKLDELGQYHYHREQPEEEEEEEEEFFEAQQSFSSSSSSPSSFVQPDLVLPNPNPNRLIPPGEDGIDLSGGGRPWLRQWLKEVKENKEFIRDMEFYFQMQSRLKN